MHPPPTSRRLFLATVSAAAAVLAAGAAGWGLWRTQPATPPVAHGPMLIAPMIGVIEPCIRLDAAAVGVPATLRARCTGPQGSAAALVESSLQALQPQGVVGAYPLGYTLPVPLLGLFRPTADGWDIDREQVRRFARTVQANERPLILYLFSTHFAADAPIEAELARDADNLAQTRDGPLPSDRYYDAPLYNWNFARTDTAITRRREQAITAVLDEICQLDVTQRARIRGVTLLGELHHLFPDFQAGMGFDAPYRVSDYSPASVAGFRQFLRDRFHDVGALNHALDSDYTAFEQVRPPARDIRAEPLQRYADHIDAFAHGTLPISGWLHTPGAGPSWIRIYRNGELVARTPVALGRQDVLAARPAFGTADTGWRWDMDFRRLPTGLHRIDLMLERGTEALQFLGSRQVAIMDKHQRTPVAVAQQPLPPHAPAADGVEFHIDQPREQASYYYNPLVPLWHRFRGEQVVRYLQHFDRLVARSCLSAVPRYTHQIVPFTNPSWDANKYAIEASLQQDTGLRLGVSLYGEPTYGQSFARWHRWQPYGITEFHPLRTMDAPSVQRMLAQHAARGAQFLSFFMEPRWDGQRVPRPHNVFSLDPDNPQYGSDALYDALQRTLAQPKTAASGSVAP